MKMKGFSTTPVKYEKQICKELIAAMRDGDTMAEVAANLGVSIRSLYRWASDPKKPEFKEAMELGNTLAEAYWVKLGRKGMMGEIKGWNQVSWLFYMKCRFQWKETQVLETPNNQPKLTKAELDKRIAEYTKSLLPKSGFSAKLIDAEQTEIIANQSQEA